MSEISKKIMALTTDAAFGTYVDRDEVLEIVKNAVPVEVDPAMYPDLDGLSEVEIRTIAAVSTAHNLMADLAAEFAGNDVKAFAESMGIGFRPFQELFDDPGVPINSWRDLSVREEEHVAALASLFDGLLEATDRRAKLGLLQSLTERVGGEL